MEIGPILRALIRNKIRFLLISLEVALTLAIVLNCINMMQDMRWQMNRPTGLDEDNIIVARSMPFSPDFKEDGYFDNCRKADLEMLRGLPGVIAADATNQIPLSGSGSSSGFKPLGSEIATLPANYFEGGTQLADAFGVEIIAGRNFAEDDINDSKSQNVIISKAFADKLFPDGDALGQLIQGRDPEDPDTIVGIIGLMHGSWPGWEHYESTMLRPGKPGGFNWGVRYVIRTEPGEVDNLITVIEERLLAANDGRNVRVTTLAEIKADTFEAQTAIIKMLGAVIFLLIFVTSLGIVGITSFSVTERMHHIGTRRALGARQLDILRYFLTENWVITSIGIAVGVVLTYGLNFALVTLVSGVKLDWVLVVYGVIFMWLVGLMAAFLPALRGARVSPAIATRNV
jgi:putative ABC transport system permease protein